MRDVLRAKFTQHEDLAELLVSTGDARILEAGKVANVVNRTWGEVNGKGLNILGVLLMEVRAELKEGATDKRKGRKAGSDGRRAMVVGDSAAIWPGPAETARA